MSRLSSEDQLPFEFTSLILGFCSAALGYLGFEVDGAPAGSSGAARKNLVLARHNIEIIRLLREKTKGNLTAEEEKLTEHVLADLQMKYVEASK